MVQFTRWLVSLYPFHLGECPLRSGADVRIGIFAAPFLESRNGVRRPEVTECPAGVLANTSVFVGQQPEELR
jgi:hypothetical protein